MLCCCSLKAQRCWALQGSWWNTRAFSSQLYQKIPKIHVAVNQQYPHVPPIGTQFIPGTQEGVPGQGPETWNLEVRVVLPLLLGLGDFPGRGAGTGPREVSSPLQCSCVLYPLSSYPFSTTLINHLALESRLQSFPLQMPTWRCSSPPRITCSGLPRPLLWCSLPRGPRH